MTTFVVLLRGVNVSGANKVAMPELQARLAKAGYGNVRTYINSGNAVVDGTGKPSAVEAEVEALLSKHMKVDVPVIVRTADQWAKLAAATPFPDAEPGFLYLGMAKAKPKPDALATLARYAAKGDRMELLPDGLWIAYAEGAGKSKVTPAVLDRAVGSPVTLRNWNTVRKLAELAAQGGTGTEQDPV